MKKTPTYSKEMPSFERSDCAFGVMFNSFDACNEDASKLERFGIGEFFCLKLKPDPSNRTELVVYKSILDRFKSDEKISFSARAGNVGFELMFILLHFQEFFSI